MKKRARLFACILVILCIIPFAGATADGYAPVRLSLFPGLAFPFGADRAFIDIGAIGAIATRVDLLQAAGVFSISQEIRAVQAAGIFNVADRSMQGIQLAGIFNISGDRKTGAQLGGVFNVADAVEGSQLSGIFNISGDMTGLQAAGLFNIAEDVRGVQMGIVNVARHVSGFQIGLVNISSNGVYDLAGYWAPETGLLRGTLRTGNTSAFFSYSLAFPAGSLSGLDGEAVSSFGLGTRIGSQKSLYLTLEAAVSDLLKTGETDKTAVFEPWPSLDAGLSMYLGAFHVTVGMRAEILLGSAPFLPESLQKGYALTQDLFGEKFTGYTTWYVGLGL
jgi:hypothetical protein